MQISELEETSQLMIIKRAIKKGGEARDDAADKTGFNYIHISAGGESSRGFSGGSSFEVDSSTDCEANFDEIFRYPIRKKYHRKSSSTHAGYN